MKVLHFDCFSGASGDMVVGALIDAGVPLSAIQASIASIGLSGVVLEANKKKKSGVTGTDFSVHISGDPGPPRSCMEILGLMGKSSLPDRIKALSRSIFLMLGEAEAKIHGVPVEEVHFHEVGAVDAMVDVVGAATGIVHLGADGFSCSPLPLGSGWVETAHGLLPLPAPATLELLSGFSVHETNEEGETVTPTGAAILKALSPQKGMIPMEVEKVGYGFGKKERKAGVNALRIVMGKASLRQEEVFVVEANIDDMNPQFYEALMERLYAAGAVDVFLAPLYMKKSRPGTMVTAVCPEEARDEVIRRLLVESTSIGLRFFPVSRMKLHREERKVETSFGPVRVKVALLGGKAVNIMPEYDDLKRLSMETGIPVKILHQEVMKKI